MNGAMATLLQTALALVLVLGLVAGMAWLASRLGKLRPAGNVPLRVIGAAAVGGRERVAVVEVAGKWLVVGVAPGSVNLLAQMDPQPPGDQAQCTQRMPYAETPKFAAWLQKALDRQRGS